MCNPENSSSTSKKLLKTLKKFLEEWSWIEKAAVFKTIESDYDYAEEWIKACSKTYLD